MRLDGGREHLSVFHVTPKKHLLDDMSNKFFCFCFGALFCSLARMFIFISRLVTAYKSVSAMPCFPRLYVISVGVALNEKTLYTIQKLLPSMTR